MRLSPLLAAIALIAGAVALAIYMQRDANEPAVEVAAPSVRNPPAPEPAPDPEPAEPPPALEPESAADVEPEPEMLGGRSSESLASVEDEPEELAADTAGGDDYTIAYVTLAERLTQEPRDTPEGAALEREIRDRLEAEPALAADHIELECGVTVCRVLVVGVERVDELRAIDFPGFGAKVGNVLSDDDGSETTEMLLARDAAPP